MMMAFSHLLFFLKYPFFYCAKLMVVDKIARGPTIDGNATLLTTPHFRHHLKNFPSSNINFYYVFHPVTFSIFFPGSNDSGVGGTVAGWYCHSQEYSLLVDARLIMSTDNTFDADPHHSPSPIHPRIGNDKFTQCTIW